jgi:hypothetical protein
MSKIFAILFVLSLFILLGIIIATAPPAQQPEVSLIVYTKDNPTGLCFAVFKANNQVGLSEVPCEKVALDK